MSMDKKVQASPPPMASWRRGVYKALTILIHDDVIRLNIVRVTGHFAGISLVTGEFPAQRQVTRSFGVFYREAGDLGSYRAHYDVTVM